MYTQCPECRTVYQVGPDDLKRAHGRVRCGSCSTVFDALEALSHEPPPPQPAVSQPPEKTGTEISEADAGEIESLEPKPEPEHEPEPETEPAPEPQRFGDDTPLEEILASFGSDFSAEENPEEDEEPRGPDVTAPDQPPAESADAKEPAVGEAASENLGDEDEWRALLAELELDESSLGVGLDRETGEEDGDSSGELPQAAEEQAAEAHAAEPEETGPGEPDAMIDETQPPGDEEGRPAGTGERDELAASAALFDEIVQSGEFAAILGPHTETAAVVDERIREDRRKPRPAAEEVRSVDGEPAGDIAAETSSADEDDDEDIIDRALLPHRRPRSRTLLWSAAAVLLVAALGAQVIHGQRTQLATHPEFGPRLQQVYGMFGADLQPRWDIGALCVESSSGDASADSLQITSVIVHQGDRPQPYPLLHVSLTDRWQSVIGSRSVEADDYVPEGELRDVRLYPGDRVQARARLSDPGSEAAGYELHVCYRGEENALRCSGACR